MRIVVSAFAILFGALHIIAAAAQFKSKDPAARGFAIAMGIGGICVILGAGAHLITTTLDWMDALIIAAGCLRICSAAYANGRQSGNLHPSHHIVRGAIAVLLVAGFVIW